MFDGIEFQWIPGGTFAMGSPNLESGHLAAEILHMVTISKGFWLGKYEVTQAQWNRNMGANPSLYPGNNRPVDNVSSNDSQDFFTLLNVSSSSTAYRLPTEA